MYTVLRAQGFSCPSCVAKIEKQLDRMDGVDNAQVHFASGRITVNHDASRTSVDDLIKAVSKEGYVATPAAF